MNGSQGIMRIGEVHTQLRKYFPEIELSKIRYYEDKGLVQPSRSRKGYRLYSQRDVECLREAIRLAQEEFVPLRVVRLRLIEQGLLKDVPVASSPRHAAREAVSNVVSIPAPTAAPTSGERPTLSVVPSTEEEPATSDAPLPNTSNYLSTREFVALTGLSASALHQLHALGVLAPVKVGSEIAFTEGDVRVATAVNALLERGLDIRLLGSVRRVAEREIGLLEDLSAPLRSRGSGLTSDQAQSVTVELAGEVAALRALLYQRALSDYLGP
ncbi:MAG TPA: MerR family transcriptional regulator [Acidimicrobiales bacterium]